MDRRIKVTFIGAIVNLILPPIKIIAGGIGGSGALIADGIHSLSDLISDLFVLIFLRLARRPRDVDHDYGHGRYETIATLFLSVALLGVAVVVCYDAALQLYLCWLYQQLPPQPSTLTLNIVIFSILCKEWLFHYTRKVAVELHSDTLLANAWHHRSDVYSSIATLIGIGGAILIGGIGQLLEPIAALLVGGFIAKIGLRFALRAINELSDRHIGADVEAEIIRIVSDVPHVYDPHNLKTRHLGPDYAIEFDIRVDPQMTVQDAHLLTIEIEQRLRERYGASTHIVIHVEPLDDPTPDA